VSILTGYSGARRCRDDRRDHRFVERCCPIGGLKEKLLAAGRGGIKTVLIPEENVKDLAEIADEIKNRLDIRPVRWIEHVLEAALERQPTPLPETAADASAVPPVAAPDEKPALIKH
jgi:ATP-dependent Lon protease